MFDYKYLSNPEKIKIHFTKKKTWWHYVEIMSCYICRLAHTGSCRHTESYRWVVWLSGFLWGQSSSGWSPRTEERSALDKRSLLSENVYRYFCWWRFCTVESEKKVDFNTQKSVMWRQHVCQVLHQQRRDEKSKIGDASDAKPAIWRFLNH